MIYNKNIHSKYYMSEYIKIYKSYVKPDVKTPLLQREHHLILVLHSIS